MLQQKYSNAEILTRVRERWKIWLDYFNTFEPENRPAFTDDYCDVVADMLIRERAEERNLPALLNSIPDKTILLALKREEQIQRTDLIK